MRAGAGVRAAGGLLLVLTAVGAAAGQESCPEAADGPAGNGWEALRLHEVDEARRWFEEALSRCPDQGSARTGLGYLHLREGVPETARVLFRSVAEADPANVDAHVGLGLLAWRRGDLDAVERHFRTVLELLPGEPTARRYLARAEELRDEERAGDRAGRAWSRGERERSLELYSARVAADPTDVQALYRLALLRAWTGRHAEALELVDRLIELRPSDPAARVARARILAASGRTGRALTELDAVLEERPAQLQVLEAMADILMGRAEELGPDPEDGDPAGVAAAAAPAPDFSGRPPLDPVRFREAAAVLDSLSRAEPDVLEHRIGLGRVLTYAGRYDSARVVLRGVLERSPGNLRAQQGLARALAFDGRLRAAETAWRRAVRTDPTDVEGWLGLARTLRWQERTAAALSALERARSRAPGDPRVEDGLRRVRAALAPRIRAGWGGRDDGVGGRLVASDVSAAWNPLPRAAVRVEARRAEASADRPLDLTRTAQEVLVSVGGRLEPGWTLAGGAGGSESDGSGRPGLARLRARATSPAGFPLRASVAYDRRLRARTALEIERGVRVDRWDALLRWRPGGLWSVAGSGGWSVYRGRERNSRWDVALGVTRRLGWPWSLGLGLRTFGYDRDVDDGYFDPDFYGLAEVELGWSRSFGRWGVEVAAAPGAQRVGDDGSLAAALRARGRLSLRVAPGRRAFLEAGYARNGLVESASGLTDYDYRTLRVGGSWAVY